MKENDTNLMGWRDEEKNLLAKVKRNLEQCSNYLKLLLKNSDTVSDNSLEFNQSKDFLNKFKNW